MDMNALSYTGVIATILSVVFAVAAFWNSHIRRKHMERLSKQTEQNAMPHVNFKPVPANTPPPPKPLEDKSAPIFRQFGPHGDLVASQPEEDNNQYVWE